MTGVATRMNDSHAMDATDGNASRVALALSTLAAMISETVEALALWREEATQWRRLMELDARLLSDIGLSRAPAVSEAEKPVGGRRNWADHRRGTKDGARPRCRRASNP